MTRQVDWSTPVYETSLASSVVSLRKELAANFQNPFDLEDSSFFTKVVPVSQQWHNNLEPLALLLYSPISFSLPNSSLRAVPLPLSPQDILLPLSPLALLLLSITFNSQNHSSMAAPTIIMLARGEQAAPLFDKSCPARSLAFSMTLKFCLPSTDRCGLQQEEVCRILYQFWDWANLEILRRVQCRYVNLSELQRCDTEYYPDAVGDYVYSMWDVDMLIALWDPWGVFFTRLTYESGISDYKGMNLGHMNLGWIFHYPFFSIKKGWYSVCVFS